MERFAIKQIGIDDLFQESEFDIIICSTGYESRASFLANKVRDLNIPLKYVIAFKDQLDIPTRKRNDNIFKRLDYSFIENEKDDNNFINQLLPIINEISNTKKVRILIDYSSMTRTWFATFINVFQFLSINIKLYFSYSTAKFCKPIPNISPSIKFDPIPGFNNLSIPEKPTALIIGLGYEKDRAAGLIEYFDAQEIFLFHTDTLEYRDYIIKANKTLVKQVPENNIIPYPIDDVVFTHTILTNLCRDLAMDYRIIIAPCGPKPFSILSYIVGIQLGYIDIWRISGENDPIKENRYPSGKLIVFSLEKQIESLTK